MSATKGSALSTGPDTPGPVGAPAASRAPGADVGHRWLPVWEVYVGVVLAVSTVLAFADRSLGSRSAAAVLTLVAVQAVAFWWVWIHRPIWDQPLRLRAAYVVLLLATSAALMLLASGFQALQFSLYPQIFLALPVTWAAVASLSLAPILALDTLVAHDWDVAAAMPTILLECGSVVAFTVLCIWIHQINHQNAQRRVLIEELQRTRDELAAAERQAGTLEERARLAREIHDTLAQGFASVVTQLEAADASLRSDPERASRHMHEAEDVARASLAETRALVWALRPDAIATAGLSGAIERLAGSSGGNGGPSVEVEISGTARPLHPDVEVTLLRAAQEALANARRHAGASHITVTLTYFDDEVSLDVIDDGRGFDPAAVLPAGPTGGYGLRGMRERAERLGGRLEIESQSAEGTAVAITLPAIPAAGAPEDVARLAAAQEIRG
jgi:signal transduction histidine kinase